jgi:transcriptional regulator with XRE-family HTH domain
MFDTKIIAERIKAMAKSQNTTVDAVLKAAGVSYNFMTPLRNGSVPKVDNLASIADQLNCSVDYLLGRTDDVIPQNRPTDKSDGGIGMNEKEKIAAGLVGLANAYTQGAALAVKAVQELLKVEGIKDAIEFSSVFSQLNQPSAETLGYLDKAIANMPELLDQMIEDKLNQDTEVEEAN